MSQKFAYCFSTWFNIKRSLFLSYKDIFLLELNQLIFETNENGNKQTPIQTNCELTSVMI